MLQCGWRGVVGGSRRRGRGRDGSDGDGNGNGKGGGAEDARRRRRRRMVGGGWSCSGGAGLRGFRDLRRDLVA